MSHDVVTIIALLAIAAFGGWLYRNRTAAARRRVENQGDLERHDHARAHEMAKIQAELTRWSGPH